MNTDSFLALSGGVVLAVVALLIFDPFTALIIASFWSTICFGRWYLER